MGYPNAFIERCSDDNGVALRGNKIVILDELPRYGAETNPVGERSS